MQDNTLMKIALVAAILGIAALFFISDSVSYDTDINIADVGSKVNIKGKVLSVSEYGDFQIVEISYFKKDKVLIFENTSINPSDEIEVIGRVQEYKGKKEIIADEYRKI